MTTVSMMADHVHHVNNESEVSKSSIAKVRGVGNNSIKSIISTWGSRICSSGIRLPHLIIIIAKLGIGAQNILQIRLQTSTFIVKPPFEDI